jgi:hypothetical protein
MKKSIIWLFLSILMTSCMRRPVLHVDLSDKSIFSQGKEVPNITVWVHGTKLFTGKIFPTFFHSEPGLLPACNYTDQNHLKKVANWLFDYSPDEFPFEHFYQFGWSGELSVAARERAAKELSEELSALVGKYRDKYGKDPYLTVITHSHGGNVALNLDKFNKDYIINRLVILACPVQKETKDLIKSGLFQEIYSLYSTFDSIQILDPQGLQYKVKDEYDFKAPLFSQREFDNVPNLKQGRVKLHGRGIMHVEFLLPHFLKYLSRLLYELKNSEDKNVILSVWRNKNYIK